MTFSNDVRRSVHYTIFIEDYDSVTAGAAIWRTAIQNALQRAAAVHTAQACSYNNLQGNRHSSRPPSALSSSDVCGQKI